MKKLTLIFISIVGLLFVLQSAFTQEKIAAEERKKQTFAEVNNPPEVPMTFIAESNEKEWMVSKLRSPWLIQDNNNDGKADYGLIVLGEDYTKSREGIDNNYDGYIDDFAYFDKTGEIVYQEIDSNYDRQIDIWVEIDEGRRIVRIQRDLDYDGVVDRDLK